MPWEAHPTFADVPDDQPLWRYVPYAAYVETLRAGALHFSRVDRLRDPHEGRVDPWVGLDPLPPEERRRALSLMTERSPEFVVNCWCGLSEESMGLWERYAAPFGVAMRTTAGRLRLALQDAPGLVWFGRVRYGGPAFEGAEKLNVMRYVMRKLPAYADEHEVRLVAWVLTVDRGCVPTDLHPCWPDYFRDGEWPPEGVLIPVDLPALLEEVWVGPPWATWFYEQVRDVSASFGVPAERVRRSLLMDPPRTP